ncbi:hypothetical protein [Cohnella abietis]|uniref:Copper amine oxidase-like N-terminal domain-containing protein n=1 Tax=Cohnella abietis TaxID=2507935 RepID=A0A3T1D3I1_9BACL|nr:hypothetical protein [Cohnella abietis]BBI32672.1 hypothetical protein KCTCHS21_20710 [Cohnella abietis]
MKKKIFIISTVMLLILASFTLGSYAATKYTLKLDGKVVKTDVREINGTLYAPIKTITDFIGGLDYNYDKKTETIAITPKTAPKSNIGLARSNPAPLKTKASISIDNIIEKYSATISVDEAIRGEEAWKLIQEANQFNSEAVSGFEYLLAKISVTVTKTAKTDAQISISGGSFTLVSTTGKDYGYAAFAVSPDPKLDSNLYTGASNTGWAVFQVQKDDSAPLLAFGRKYDGTGGIWFKVK